MDSCKANSVLGNFAKKLGFGQTPPLVGPKDQLFPFFNFEGSPYNNFLWGVTPHRVKLTVNYMFSVDAFPYEDQLIVCAKG